MMTIRYQWMSMTVCMRAFSSPLPEFCPTFEWCQMDHCWQDVVWWLVDHSCLGLPRRDVCCRSTLQAWCCKCHWRFSGDASTHFDRSRILTHSVVELNRPVTHWWLMTFTSSKSTRILPASRWLVGLDYVIDSSGLWLLGRICIHLSMCIRCRSLIAWITNYYIILI